MELLRVIFKVYCHTSLQYQVHRLCLASKPKFLFLIKGLATVVLPASKLDLNFEPKNDPVDFLFLSAIP